MKTFLIRIALLMIAGTAGLSAQTKRQWIPVNQRFPEGSPIVVNVVETNEKGTELEVMVPGFWAEEVRYANRAMTKLLLPAVRITGKGYPAKPGEPGWWDFPAEMNQVPIPGNAFESAGDGSVRKSIFPPEALGKEPRTAEEMKKLGIDPAGARPGLPRLRMLFAALSANGDGDIGLEMSPEKPFTVKLPNAVVPAGFEGLDQEEIKGYTPPQLVDEEFYKVFRGNYRGEEPLLDSPEAFGPFSGVSCALPVLELASATEVIVAPVFKVYLQHLKGTLDFDCPIPWDFWTSLPAFINGAAIREAISIKGLKIEASRSAHYLILCPQEWRDTLEPFALWKQTKGLNVDFAYVGPGKDVEASRSAIDAYIEAEFKRNYCHGQYVLICGDQDVIPSGRSSRITAGPDFSDNSDSDHVYETIGTSRFPSVYVGRLSANTEAELKAQLDKILVYERTPRLGNWPTRVTLCANSQMDDEDFGVNSDWPTKYSLAVEETAAYGGYILPPAFEKLHAGAASNTTVRATNADVIDSLDGGIGQLLYRGHGSDTAWVSGWDGSGTGSGSSFNAATHVNSLENTVFPIVYSIACQNNRINRNDSIGERWMSLEGAGAVAHYGASVNSYTTENHERCKAIFRAIYESGYTRLGPMLAKAERLAYSTSGGGEAWESNTFGYILLGDPEMTIRRKSISRLVSVGGLSTIVRSVREGLEFQVVDQNKVPVPAAFVRLSEVGGGSRNAFADADGKVLLPGVSEKNLGRLDLLADGFPYTAIWYEAPEIEPVGFVREGGFKVRLLNVPQGTFHIYGSDDGKEWIDLGVATPGADDLSQEFIDTKAPVGSGARRFYRAVQK